MKKFFLLPAAFTVINSGSVSAQTWSSIATLTGMDCSYGVDDLKTFDDDLYIIGGFRIANSDSSCWSCHWDGSNLIPHPAFVDGCGIYGLDIFHDSLYAVGGLQFNNGFDGQGVGVWNGTTWQTGSDLFDGGEFAIYADSDDLYIGDWAGLVNKKTGNGSFAPLSDSFEGPNQLVNAIIKYNGNIIAGGYWISYNGDTMNDIARWDGTTWQPLGTGIYVGPGYASWVRCLKVFNGELYVGGYFEFAGGVPARGIAKWNGTSWSDVGGSITSNFGDEIYDMKVYGNALYVVGTFTQIGGVNAKYLASWNGTSWHDEGFDVELDHGLSCVEVYNNAVYVGTVTYSYETGHVYRASFKTGISVEKDSIDLSIFPNPSSGFLYVNFAFDNPDEYKLEIYAASGTLMYRQFIRTDQSLDLNFLSQGVYTLLLRKRDEVLQRKELIVL